MADEVLGFQRRWQKGLRRVPLQMADEIPEGSGADSKQSSEGADADG